MDVRLMLEGYRFLHGRVDLYRPSHNLLSSFVVAQPWINQIDPKGELVGPRMC